MPLFFYIFVPRIIDPLIIGASAVFGPGRFGNVFTSMNAPAADGLLHFAGDALSPRHAWVEGALDSAHRAVIEMLFGLLTDRDQCLSQCHETWGYNPEWALAQPRKSLPESSETPWGTTPFPPEGKEIPDFEHNLILRYIARTYFQSSD